ncbi:MAG: hypothetical protein ACE5GZ_12560 [Gammaproteobacteria bacterium]
MGIYSVDKLVAEARRLAREYREATGKTLPITAEIAINDAIRLLTLTPAGRDDRGFDATMLYRGDTLRVQIKGRVIFNERKSGYRLGQLKLEQSWQATLLVLMNSEFEPDEIYLAHRDAILNVLDKSKSRRGAISVARFKAIGELVWSEANGLEDDGYWTNVG